MHTWDHRSRTLAETLTSAVSVAFVTRANDRARYDEYQDERRLCTCSRQSIRAWFYLVKQSVSSVEIQLSLRVVDYRKLLGFYRTSNWCPIVLQRENRGYRGTLRFALVCSKPYCVSTNKVLRPCEIEFVMLTEIWRPWTLTRNSTVRVFNFSSNAQAHVSLHHSNDAHGIVSREKSASNASAL